LLINETISVLTFHHRTRGRESCFLNASGGGRWLGTDTGVVLISRGSAMALGAMKVPKSAFKDLANEAGKAVTSRLARAWHDRARG
jgi:hypothetical protein